MKLSVFFYYVWETICKLLIRELFWNKSFNEYFFFNLQIFFYCCELYSYFQWDYLFILNQIYLFFFLQFFTYLVDQNDLFFEIIFNNNYKYHTNNKLKDD